MSSAELKLLNNLVQIIDSFAYLFLVEEQVRELNRPCRLFNPRSAHPHAARDLALGVHRGLARTARRTASVSAVPMRRHFARLVALALPMIGCWDVYGNSGCPRLRRHHSAAIDALAELSLTMTVYLPLAHLQRGRHARYLSGDVFNSDRPGQLQEVERRAADKGRQTDCLTVFRKAGRTLLPAHHVS